MGTPEIQLLGSGTAFHQDGRGSQCLVVRPTGEPPFLVDLGPTALAAAARFGVPTGELERLFVTHLHGDHLAGWPFLLLNLNFIDRRTRPFHVHGPVGVRACLEGMMRLCYPDVLDGPGLSFEVHYHEIEVREAAGLEAGAIGFDVLPMSHHPSSIGYCFNLCGKRVAVTGDTRWCPNLERLARASDLLLVECTTVERQEHAHVSLDELRSAVDRLGPCAVVLVHLTDDVAADLAANPLPRVIAGHDGMILPL